MASGDWYRPSQCKPLLATPASHASSAALAGHAGTPPPSPHASTHLESES